MSESGGPSSTEGRRLARSIAESVEGGGSVADVASPDDLRALRELPPAELAALLPMLVRIGDHPMPFAFGNVLLGVVERPGLDPADVPVDAILDAWLEERVLDVVQLAWLLGRAGLGVVAAAIQRRVARGEATTVLLEVLAATGRLLEAPPPILGSGPDPLEDVDLGEPGHDLASSSGSASRGDPRESAPADARGGGGGSKPQKLLATRRPAPAPGRDTPERYANVLVVGERDDETVTRLPPGTSARLRVDIGALGRTQVGAPRAFPDDVLPDEDVTLELMFASAHLLLPGERSAAHARLELPADRSRPATTPDGERYVYFPFTTPAEGPSAVRARLGFYFREALVQSFLLDVEPDARLVSIEVDYTASASISALGRISARPRVSVMTNDNGAGRHAMYVRHTDDDDSPSGRAFEVGEGSAKAVARLRQALHARSPTTPVRPPEELAEDLRRFATAGHRLYLSFKSGLEAELHRLRRDPDTAVLSVARPVSSTFSLPWAWSYDIRIDARYLDDPGKLPLCPLVETWNGRDPLFEGSPRRCPHADLPEHRANLLCPFGFWGVRYSIESTSSRDAPGTLTLPGPRPLAAAALTQEDVDLRVLDDHVDELARILSSGMGPTTEVRVAKDLRSTWRHLAEELGVLYFYCHGQREKDHAETYLAVGRNDALPPGDYLGRVDEWLDEMGHRPWEATQPLVFINACHSLDIRPETTISYVDAFVASGRAAGVIGTEVRVDQALARDFAEGFFRRWLGDDSATSTLDGALRETRFDFLRRGHLFGLYYTSHCWADLRLERAATPDQSAGSSESPPPSH